MLFLDIFYKMARKKEPPYYLSYPLWLVVWKPVRKFINVVVIPTIPFNFMRVLLYRLVGYKIGKKVFIGMRCYLDDVDPGKTIIGNRVVISYGCYFSCHGKGQRRTEILIDDGAYLGMRTSVISGKSGVRIGKNAIVGAASLVTRSVPDDTVALGVPAKIKRSRM